MPRKNIGEIKSRFIAQIADAETKRDEAARRAETELQQAEAARDTTINEARSACEARIATSRREFEMADAHVAGLKAALAVFDDPKKAGAPEAPTS